MLQSTAFLQNCFLPCLLSALQSEDSPCLLSSFPHLSTQPVPTQVSCTYNPILVSASKMNWTEARDCSEDCRFKVDQANKAPISQDNRGCCFWYRLYVHTFLFYFQSLWTAWSKSFLFSFFFDSSCVDTGIPRMALLFSQFKMILFLLYLCQYQNAIFLTFMKNPNIWNLSLKAAPWYCGRKWAIIYPWNIRWFWDNSVKISYLAPFPLTCFLILALCLWLSKRARNFLYSFWITFWEWNASTPTCLSSKS